MRLWPWRTHAEKVTEVLSYLDRHGETLGKVLGDACKLGLGTRYVLFYQMEEQGLISSRLSPDDPFNRRLYRIVEGGRRKLADAEALNTAAMAWGI